MRQRAGARPQAAPPLPSRRSGKCRYGFIVTVFASYSSPVSSICADEDPTSTLKVPASARQPLPATS